VAAKLPDRLLQNREDRTPELTEYTCPGFGPIQLAFHRADVGQHVRLHGLAKVQLLRQEPSGINDSRTLSPESKVPHCWAPWLAFATCELTMEPAMWNTDTIGTKCSVPRSGALIACSTSTKLGKPIATDVRQ
jgi:hypothetical protein